MKITLACAGRPHLLLNDTVEIPSTGSQRYRIIGVEHKITDTSAPRDYTELTLEPV